MITSRLSSAALRPVAGSPPGPEPAGELLSDLDPLLGHRSPEHLQIGVHGDEIDAGKPVVHHPVDSVAPGAPDPHDLENGQPLLLFEVKTRRHYVLSFLGAR